MEALQLNLTNKSDFRVPSKPQPARVANYTNWVPRCRGQLFHKLSHPADVATVVTVAIDPARNVFSVLAVDATGKLVLVRPSVSRAKLREPFDKLRANG